MLDLQIREMEIYVGNFQSLRNTVVAIMTLGGTMEALLAGTAVAHDPGPSNFDLVLGLGAFVIFLIVGIASTWAVRGGFGWPDGFAIETSPDGSLVDYKRQLLDDMRGELERVKTRFRRYQLTLVPLTLTLLFSIGTWVWILKVIGKTMSPSMSP